MTHTNQEEAKQADFDIVSLACFYLSFCGGKASSALRTGSGAGDQCRLPRAMASSVGDHRPFWRDDEVVVDKDGIPHYSGAVPGLMTEYRRRVLFAYDNLEGDGDTPEKEKKDLEKRQSRFAKKLLDSLHGEAWKACQSLLGENDKLREKDGYKHVFRALQSIEKAAVLRKTEAFEQFFEKCQRHKGQSIDSWLRKRTQEWNDLIDLTENTMMSEDLRAFFLLKHASLSREDRRQVLLANQSDYTLEGIEKSLRISFHDIHEREGRREWPKKAGYQYQPKYKKHYANLVDESEVPENVENYDEIYDPEELLDPEESYAVEEEEDPPSDLGASDDDEVHEAYASYQASRNKLKELQRNRGFFRGDFKGEISLEERKAAVQREKQRTRCAACGRVGHWAGDAACSKSHKSGPKKMDGKRSGGGKGKGKSKGKTGGKAFYVEEGPRYFSLGSEMDEEDAFCHMVHDDETTDEMHDADLDARRKKARAPPSESDWEAVEPVEFDGTSYASMTAIPEPYVSEADDVPVKIEMTVPSDKIKVLLVPSFEEVMPKKLHELKAYQLQAECASGNKSDMKARLMRFFAGEPIQKKGCTKQFVQLRLDRPSSTTSPRKVASSSSDGQMPVVKPKTKLAPKPMPEKLRRSKDFAYAVKEDPNDYQLENDQIPAASFGKSGYQDPSHGFRRDEAEQRAARFREEFVMCSRTGIAVPVDRVGKADPNVPCPTCGNHMAIRRNRDDGGLFFGCSRYSQPTGCRGTRKLIEVDADYYNWSRAHDDEAKYCRPFKGGGV